MGDLYTETNNRFFLWLEDATQARRVQQDKHQKRMAIQQAINDREIQDKEKNFYARITEYQRMKEKLKKPDDPKLTDKTYDTVLLYRWLAYKAKGMDAKRNYLKMANDLMATYKKNQQDLNSYAKRNEDEKNQLTAELIRRNNAFVNDITEKTKAIVAKLVELKKKEAAEQGMSPEEIAKLESSISQDAYAKIEAINKQFIQNQ